MKIKLVLFLFFAVFTNLFSQSIENQLNDLGVFKEKVVYEWIDKEKLDDTAPFVVVDWTRRPSRYKKIDPKKVVRVERLNQILADHLYEEDAKYGVYRLVIDEKTNKEAFFKLVTNPPFHSSCRGLEDKKSRKKCTREYLDSELINLVEDQQKFVLEIAIDRTGKVVETNIRKGKSSPALEKLFEKWKRNDFEWYPGMQKNYFVNTYYYYEFQRD